VPEAEVNRGEVLGVFLPIKRWKRVGCEQKEKDGNRYRNECVFSLRKIRKKIGSLIIFSER